jgi:anaerobic ribonucleoside-triphosphate reductase activating protein
MNFIPDEASVVFQEVPGEVSLTFSITGCARSCFNCHSPHLQDQFNGEVLSVGKLMKYLDDNKGYITNVIFFGGEWDSTNLCFLLDLAKASNLKTTLFTAEKSVPSQIQRRLDYLKTGEYIDKLGGLSSPTTNQKMVNLKMGEDITYKYQQDLNTNKELTN